MITEIVLKFCIWKNKTLILIYLDSQRTSFDLGHLQGVNWGQSWTKNWNFVKISCLCKIQVFQNTLNSICTNMRTTSGQNFSSICCLLELSPPNPPKLPQLGPKPKNVVLLPGKVKNKKYTESETCLSENLW